MTRAEILHEHPEAGRIVPECRNPSHPGDYLSPYRIVYRLDIERRLVEIARVWHAARGTPMI
jgi:plasmid stabilization system protein ParE